VKLVLALALISLAAATTACSDSPQSSRADAEATATKIASSPPRATSRPARYRPVRFSAADGVYLVGRLWGTGDVGVILAHGFSHGSAQDGWLQFAPALVSRGYSVLTFNFRGFCDSEGCSDRRGDLGKNWRFSS
jgi:dipeptidyl aminopeptidase/acylaminoacyl peptidase